MQGLQFAMEIVKSFKNVIISSIIRCNYWPNISRIDRTVLYIFWFYKSK